MDTGFNIGNDEVDRFFRSFTSVAPKYNTSEIIVFGYEGLQGRCKTAKEQTCFELTDSNQKLKRYHVFDNGVRYREV